MTRQPIVLAALVIGASLSFVPIANAQLLSRWFGTKTPEKNPPAKVTPVDPRRVIEVNVEIAWLADPVTFPYYLEAHATGTQLEVRGYVPNKAVRDHAIRIAQVQSSVPVVDSIKEHPSLLVKTSQMSPQQLQSSVTSSLRTALPKQYQQLKTSCGADGQVQVTGPVNTYDEKLAVSHALRRLHGCTSVQNLTLLPAELAANRPREKTPIIKTSNPTEKPMPDKFESKKPADPVLIPPVPDLKAQAPTPTSVELKKRIKATCPEAKDIEVQFKSDKDVSITIEIRTEKELTPVFERVMQMPELQNIRPEIQFKITP